jgi:excisionase family DNA binding protein
LFGTRADPKPHYPEETHDMTFEDAPDVLSITEAAALLRLGRSLAYEAVQRGELPAVRVGRKWLVSKTSLQEFVNGKQGSSK